VKPDDEEKPVISKVEKSKQMIMIDEKKEKLDKSFKSRFEISAKDPKITQKYIFNSNSQTKKYFKNDFPNELSKFFKELTTFKLIHKLERNEFFTEMIGYVLEEKDLFFGYILIETYSLGNLHDFIKEINNSDDWYQIKKSDNVSKINQEREMLIELLKQIAEGRKILNKKLLDKYFLTRKDFTP
jgi:hypothetical protein